MTTNHCSPCFMNPLRTYMSNRCSKGGSKLITRYKMHTTIFLHASFYPIYPARNQIPVFLAVTYFLEETGKWALAWLGMLCLSSSRLTLDRELKEVTSFFTIKNKRTKPPNQTKNPKTKHTPTHTHTTDREKFNTSEELRQNPLVTGSFKIKVGSLRLGC